MREKISQRKDTCTHRKKRGPVRERDGNNRRDTGRESECMMSKRMREREKGRKRKREKERERKRETERERDPDLDQSGSSSSDVSIS